MVASRLIVRCGVPVNEDGEAVYWLGISMFTISCRLTAGPVFPVKLAEVLACICVEYAWQAQ
jgi:hypothetical protein